MKTTLPRDWNPECPEHYNRWQRHIRSIRSSQDTGEVDAGFQRLADSMNAKKRTHEPTRIIQAQDPLTDN